MASQAERDFLGTLLSSEADQDDTTLEDHLGVLSLELKVRDPDVVQTLQELPEGRSRHEFALDALRIGVLALRHAGARLDADVIRRASDELLASLKQTLEQHTQASRLGTEGVLKEYFDPQSGRLAERVGRLVSEDGELAQLLKSQLHGEGSHLARSLDARLGEKSPLMKLLSPDQSQGLLASLRSTIDAELIKQRDRVLAEFSLDNSQGALARLVRELTGKHGELSKDLQGKIDEVIKEFDLNKEDSALRRLVNNVERAQRTISSEFSLDNEGSGLARLKSELATILSAHLESNRSFQEEVKVALATLTARREAAARSTEHGVAFEDVVGEFLCRDAEGRGDLCDATGAVPGAISGRKYGDFVLTLGPDTAAPAAKIVFEAKDDKAYTLSAALDEIAQARKNRQADFGVFIMASSSARPELPRFRRYGPDIIVQWDAEDPTTDPYMLAALEVARACVIDLHRGADQQELDLPGIEKAINQIEKHAANLDSIRKPAENIRKGADAILERVRIDEEGFSRQIAILRNKLTALRTGETLG